jgi:hypothetical protein
MPSGGLRGNNRGVSLAVRPKRSKEQMAEEHMMPAGRRYLTTTPLD